MSNLKINGKEFNDIQLVKLDKGKTNEAIARLNTSAQGADDVVFKIGDDVFVASGRDMFPDKKMGAAAVMGGEGVTVELDGKKAEVVAWDNQANNGKECAKWAGKHLWMLAPMVWAVAASTFPKLKLLTTLALGVGAVGASTAGAAAYGASRKIEVDELAEMGTVVQKNTQSKGGWGDAIGKLFGK